MGQAIRRDPRTQLLLVVCSECGSYEPALDATTAARTWLHRLLMLPTVLWVLTVISLWGLAAWIVAALPYVVAFELTYPQRMTTPSDDGRGYEFSYICRPPDWDRDDVIVACVCTAVMFGVVLVWSMLNTTFTPHWRRRPMQYFNIVWPALALSAGAWLAHSDLRIEGGLIGWGWPVLLAFAGACVIGGVMGPLIGRPVVRFVLRIVLPARPRSLFSYLWIVDGKALPVPKKA